MTTLPGAARPLDHLVLPTADIGVARQRLAQLGFTVAADARHPFGTENACVFLPDKTYMEPLGIACREECEAAAANGNIFIARDQAFRFRRGSEGLSAIVLGTDDATRDHMVFRAQGLSGGDVLEFSRSMLMPGGETATGSFRLAFAADLRSPDLFLFTCQRLMPLPNDRSALESHENGVLGLSQVVLSEPNPTDFQYLLQMAVNERAVTAHSFGMEIMTANGVALSVLNPDGMDGFYGRKTSTHARGLRGQALVFKVANLAATEQLFAANGVPYTRQDTRLLVAQAPGQGVLFVFGE